MESVPVLEVALPHQKDHAEIENCCFRFSDLVKHLMFQFHQFLLLVLSLQRIVVYLLRMSHYHVYRPIIEALFSAQMRPYDLRCILTIVRNSDSKLVAEFADSQETMVLSLWQL